MSMDMKKYEVTIPTRGSDRTEISVFADNHLMALKKAMRTVQHCLPPVEVVPDEVTWRLVSLDGKLLGTIRRVA